MPGRSDASAPLSLVRVKAGDQIFCLDATAVLGVYRSQELEQAPRGSGMLGWLSASGERVPVHALTAWVGASSHPVDRCGPVILLLNSTRGRYGLAADRVDRMPEVAAERRRPLPQVRVPSPFDGVVALPDGWVLHLSAELPDASIQPRREVPRGSPLAVDPRKGMPAPTGQRRVLTFAVPGIQARFALSHSQILELRGPETPVPVPGWPRILCGVVEYRGHPIPVADLARCLGLPATPFTAVRRILVARPAGSSEAVALVTGAEIRSESLPIAHRIWTGDSPFGLDYVSGLFESGGLPLVVPDLERIIAGGFLRAGTAIR